MRSPSAATVPSNFLRQCFLTLLSFVVLTSNAAAGQGNGPAGANRTFRLFHVFECSVCMEVGTPAGDVTLFRPFSPTHPVFPGDGLLELKFTLDNLFCWVGPLVDTDDKDFWALYLTTESHGRKRLQNFNTECFTGKHQSRVLLGLVPVGYTEAEVFGEHLIVEIVHERDDSLDGGEVFVRGEI